MSYNPGINGWSDWFSELDILALKSIWARENDNGIINFNNESNSYKFTRNNSNKYHIQTITGMENITNLEKLIFADKDMNISSYIIDVFNQVNGIDNITGKILRLYEASFNRIPDKYGLTYWIHMNSTGENTLQQTSKSFI